ncbi:unnamed protein product [Allacma fusca]|uniref:Uncharacterized protein n=1 Tax=Allacma fusca TaxID=39272 RepID=A0A8J2KP22_9HEXA|nr:unnamed protein product [Allacma fusca]
MYIIFVSFAFLGSVSFCIDANFIARIHRLSYDYANNVRAQPGLVSKCDLENHLHTPPQTSSELRRRVKSLRHFGPEFGNFEDYSDATVQTSIGYCVTYLMFLLIEY